MTLTRVPKTLTLIKSHLNALTLGRLVRITKKNKTNSSLLNLSYFD